MYSKFKIVRTGPNTSTCALAPKSEREKRKQQPEFQVLLSVTGGGCFEWMTVPYMHRHPGEEEERERDGLISSCSTLPCGGLVLRVAGREYEEVEDFLREQV